MDSHNRKYEIEVIHPVSFESENHFYSKVLNSHLHPLVSYFFEMSSKQIIERYTHLNPRVSKSFLEYILTYPIKHFFWGGSDLFYVTTEEGNRRIIVLETNSCPSGQKSMPLRHHSDEFRGYKALMEESFIPLLKKKRLPQGALAVIYDKNYMEASGYAATLAELCNEPVYLIPHYIEHQANLIVKDKVLNVIYEDRSHPIRAALRYVTQKPWNRLPIETSTLIYNSTLVCLAGGRNKLMASKAYEFFNSDIVDNGIQINTPETIRDVNKVEVPLWVQRFGGYAVVKDPYSNAGQGVYTITSEEELDHFMSKEHDYDQFIVQSLIGHYEWSSQNEKGRFYHIGTMPSKKGSLFVADLRMMVYSSQNGFSPCALYARRARCPLVSQLDSHEKSWDMLGTNLSYKTPNNEWQTDTARLMQMDIKDFNMIGIGLDDLIEGYIQTVLSVIAIDNMATTLLNKKGGFRKKLFASLDNDPNLLSEIMI